MANRCIEECGDAAAVGQLHRRFRERAIRRLLALALEEELVVVGADPALGIPGIGMLAFVAQTVFVLIELKEGIDLVVQLGCSSGRRKYRSEEHTSELQSLMRISYAVFCLKKKTINEIIINRHTHTTQNTNHI